MVVDDLEGALMGAPGRPAHPLLARGSWGEVRRDGAVIDDFGRSTNVLEEACVHAPAWISGRTKAGRQLT
jgi:hypothetical protein